MRQRNEHTILVTDADTVGAIAVIRSLGRAGYRVVACADREDALGLRSTMATVSLVHPTYRDRQRFLAWLDATVREERVTLVIPSETFLLTIRERYTSYAHLLAGADPDDLERFYRQFSKHDVLMSLRACTPHDAHLPPTLLVGGMESDREIITATRRIGFPAYVKADALYAVQHADGGRVRRVDDETELAALLVDWRTRYRKLTVQGHVPGIGVAAFALMADATPVATFMHRRIHEVPHTGGVSSYRASWSHPAIHADAIARLRGLHHEGVAMVEYRWDPASDRFWFVEVNARYWGSLHLALAAGIDFPRLQADRHLGIEGPPPPATPRAVRMRLTAPLEIGHLVGFLRDPAVLPGAKVRKLLAFLYLGFNPRVKSDLLFPDDRRLYFVALGKALRSTAHSVVRRLLSRLVAALPAGAGRGASGRIACP